MSQKHWIYNISWINCIRPFKWNRTQFSDNKYLNRETKHKNRSMSSHIMNDWKWRERLRTQLANTIINGYHLVAFYGGTGSMPGKQEGLCYNIVKGGGDDGNGIWTQMFAEEFLKYFKNAFVCQHSSRRCQDQNDFPVEIVRTNENQRLTDFINAPETH